MFREMKNEAELEVILVTRGPLVIKSAESNNLNPSLPDIQCVKGRYRGHEIPIIPGSSLKGVIRYRYEQLASIMGVSCCNIVKSRCKPESKNRSGKAVYMELCPACKLFGSTYLAGRFSVRDAYAEEGYILGERTNVGINRVTGQAEGRALYQAEVVEEAKFRVKMFLKNYELYQMKLLLYILKEIDEGYIALGSAATRGYGQMGVEQISMTFREYRNNVQNLRGVISTLEVPLEEGCKDKDNPFCKEANWKNLKVEDALEKLAGVDVRLELKKQKEDKKNETDRKK